MSAKYTVNDSRDSAENCQDVHAANHWLAVREYVALTGSRADVFYVWRVGDYDNFMKVDYRGI